MRPARHETEEDIPAHDRSRGDAEASQDIASNIRPALAPGARRGRKTHNESGIECPECRQQGGHSDRIGCLFDPETGRVYHTPQTYDLDWDALGYRPCGVGAGWGDGSEAPPLSRCDDP